MAKSRKRRKLIIFAVIVLALVALTLMAVFRKRDDAISVQTDKVKRRDLTELVVANGRIQPVLQVKISPEVSGEIIELPVKEGQEVKKGDLIMKIKPEFYVAARNQAEASYKSALSSKTVSEANLAKAEAEFRRNEELFQNRLISESVFTEMQTAFTIAKAQLTNATHQIAMSRAQLARAEDDLGKTTIVSPLNGTISKLNSQVGERVVGTATMAGTDVMTIADLDEMEARVDIGEMDVVLIEPGQKARLEVDAFKNKKFTGVVTEIANSAKGSGAAMNQSQDATKFEVRIRVNEKENFRPGMSINAEVETRYRTNVLAVPIAAVTTRIPKPAKVSTNSPAGAGTNSVAATNGVTATNATTDTNAASTAKKSKESSKPVEVVFVVEKDTAKQMPVKIGISDADYYEVVEGLTDGQEIITGNYKAVSKELEDGKKIAKGFGGKGAEKK